MLLLDPASARIVRANRQAAEFYGYRAAELAGMPVSAIALAVDGRVAERIGQAMRGEANSFRTRHRLKRGDVRDVTVYASPLAASAGPLLFCFVADDTAKRLREEELHAALAQKDVLLKEIHHRVKNNLQIVANLLFLQEASLADPAARVLLQESQDRIRSMALIHEELYTSPDLSSVDMHNFLATLAGKVAASMEPPVQLRLDLAAVQLPITLSVPCGLIVNELLMNCVKHAFAGRPGGTLDLGLGEAGGLVTITVGDDGPGLPVGFAPADPKTLGLTLVNALVGQLRGRLEAETRHGALFTLTFPGGRDDV
jgi:PAS domain S-box-containing protein